jgi:hypothetical protein
MNDTTPDLPAISGSVPFIHNVDTAPAYWWLDILWIVLASSEDTGGRYSLMEEWLPKGAGAPPHKHTWSDETYEPEFGVLRTKKYLLARMRLSKDPL